MSGTHVHVAWLLKPRGTGSKLHTHPNEQFNYVVQGTIIADIDGQVLKVPAGHVIHIPAGMVHSHVSSPEEDVIFIAAKDTRHGIVGPPVDGKYDGPNCFPGFGSRAREPKITTAEAIAESKRLPCGPGKRYVYDMREDSDAAPEPASRRLSVSICRTIRPRPAPIESRTAISRLRSDARASSRFAILAQTMMSTSVTAANKAYIGCPKSFRRLE